MESSNGSGSETKPQNHQLERKRLNRAPSPARPSFLKDAHSRSPKQHAIVPKSPKLNKQQSSTVSSLTNQNRSSRRTVSGAKDKPAAVKSNSKSSVSKKIIRVIQHAENPKIAIKLDSSCSPLLVKGKKGKLASLSHGPFSPIRVPTGAATPLGRVSQTDSSSDLSDCPSEPLSDEQKQVPAAGSDAESGTGSSDRDPVGADDPEGTGGTGGAGAPLRTGEAHAGKGGMSQAPHGAGAHGGEKCKVEKPSTSAQFKQEGGKYVIEEDLLREIEDLRSENDYLKDEVDELRAEMEEVRDSYLEEEVYQLQDLRRELDRSNKSCRILQYRLRKAEQKSLRTAQTGHVDGEMLRNLEQDLKVAKDVSVRLHNELESVEDKRTRAEDENQLLRQRIIEVEINKQALTNELDRAKETASRRRGSREAFKDKKSMNQEDSADLRCQLQFSKEESTLMRKKMAKLGREKDELEQELQRYKSVYGDVDSPGLPLGDCPPGGGPHSTREAELRLRLKLVEEEANILGRKIVELEVENRGLRAENDDIRCQYERDCFGREPFASVPSSPYGGDAPESAGELRRHLQFVEEEAELLRRSIAEIEDHNKQLTSELNRFKFGPGPGAGGGGEESAAAVGEAGPHKPGNGVMMEELKAARMQINELSGKVMNLQYENRVLMSNVQRCDLAAHLGLRGAAEADAPGRREGEELGEEEEEEEEEEGAGGLLLLRPKREGPVGGESDSEDQLEKSAATSGFGSLKPSDGGGGVGGEAAGRRREERESLAGVRREAERLGKTLERLIADTDSLVYEGKLVLTGAESVVGGASGGAAAAVAGGVGYGSDSSDSSQVLDAVNSRMKAFRAELHVFVEKVDRLGDDLSPGPNLTASSSFLSGVTSMSRDSPVGTLGRDLTDFQSVQREELEWRLGQERSSAEPAGPGPAQSRGPAGPSRFHRPLALRAELRDTAGSEVQFRLDHERRLRAGLEDREAGAGSVTQEEERRRLEVRRGVLELPGLAPPPEAPWPQERALLQQEVRLFRHNTALVYMKLRWILLHWRLGRRAEAGDEATPPEFQYEKLENIPELGVIMEQGEGEAEREDRSCTPQTPGDTPEPAATAFLPSPERLQHQRQAGENRRVLHAVRTLLEEFRSELREEDGRRRQLQQTYANEKASWEVKWAEMKSHVAQLEEGEAQDAGGGVTGGGGGEEADQAFRQEREEHRRLLADSHSASLDLRWRLQHGETRWGRERAELLERFERDRQAWDDSMRDMHRKMERLQREMGGRRVDGAPADARDGAAGFRGAPSPRDSPREAPPSPSPGGGPGESLFLDALSLDPLVLDVPPPSRLDSEKRFPCMNEALNEIPDREAQPAFEEEELGSGSLLRAKSVCSMSDFQRLMDSSPFLPDKSRRGDRAPDDATPPLSPDDLKYIEEFNSEAWDFPSAAAATGITAPEGGDPASWFLTTSATLTTDTPSCHRPPSLRGNGGGASAGGGAEHYGVHVLHSPTRTGTPSPPETDFLYVKGTKGGRGGEAGAGVGPPDEAFGGGGGGRWACELPRHHKELLEGGGGGLRPAPERPPLCPTVGYASSLELQRNLELSRNLSDDMKEVAYSVRNAIRPPGAAASERTAAPQVRDTACQTNGFATRGTQTAHAVSVGLQTPDCGLRGALTTGSPHRCLTPKGGGSTPISSPSRSLRNKVQYSPAVQGKFERPCCSSPKYGSPKLQRKLSVPGKPDTPPCAAAGSVVVRPATPSSSTPPKGNSESAWARSTTTRDSPVHTTINDGLSSLFNIIDHTPVGYDAAANANAAVTAPKFAKSPSRSRPAEAGGPGGAGPAVQDLLRIARGRSPSPVGPLGDAAAAGERTPEVGGGGGGGGGSVRQDLSAPPGYTLAESAARLLNKRLLEQSFRDEKKLAAASGGGARDARQGETDRNQAACLEDLIPRSPAAPPLESRFLRPARPANRRPPSRWAAHSPSSSPRACDGGDERRFTFPPTGNGLDAREPGPD